MKVYRVEHKKTKFGPYNCRYNHTSIPTFKGFADRYYWWEEESHKPHSDDTKNHPAPWCDGDLLDVVGWQCNHLDTIIEDLNNFSCDGKTYSWKCCFSSLTKLNEWFTKSELALLCKHGFMIKSYEIEDLNVFHGEKQCIAIIGV